MKRAPRVPLDILLSFIHEDAPAGDITSDAVIGDVRCRAEIIARQAGIIAGLDEALILFGASGVEAEPLVRDGAAVDRGEVLACLEGPARAILLVERTALNIMGRMSGIASMTRRLQDLLDGTGTGCRIASTRKTAPGLRLLDKKAVILGGGDPHRMTLSDGMLIKDNHLLLVPLVEAVRAAKAHSRYRKVEVEVESADDALAAARAGADILLLDNMSPATITETLALLESSSLREKLLIEVSGGITEENIADYAILGVDLISMGALTHSVRNLDVSLEIIPG